MVEIMAIAKKYNIFVIEDCAESLGAMVGGTSCWKLWRPVDCFFFSQIK